jgi:hypothetical protein
MSDELILNPYTSLSVASDPGGDIIAAAPKPGAGLQILTFGPEKYPRLYALFLELSGMPLSMIDLANDVNEEERGLLRQYNILVPKSEAPQRPLFSCLLDDLPSVEFDYDAGSLIVNPSFRFEPFDLANFRTLTGDKHFSPYMATAWIESAGWDIDAGYWLNNEQAAVVSQFEPGKKLSLEIDRGLAVKLFGAKILVDAASLERETVEVRSEISRAGEYFLDNRYAVLRNVIPSSQIRALQTYYRDYVDLGFMKLGDRIVDRRFRQPNEPVARTFHHSMTSLMSSLAGRQLKPSYCYASAYIGGADLQPHIDREMCEYSFSFQVDYQPLPGDGISPWPLYLSTRPLGDEERFSLSWADFPANAETEKAINLGNGDVLAYKGCELAHYRHPLPAEHTSTSLFFHYVPIEYDGDLI